jgi:hypothetical protein
MYPRFPAERLRYFWSRTSDEKQCLSIVEAVGSQHFTCVSLSLKGSDVWCLRAVAQNTRFDATAVRSVADNHLHLGVALYEARDISAGLTYNLDPREAL